VDLPPVKVYAEPEHGRVYILGVDTSEGLGHGDNSAIQVLDHETGEQVCVFCDILTPDLLALMTFRLGMAYLGALAVVESNNTGIATLTVLRQLGYRSIFRRKQLNHAWNRTTEEFGFKTSRTSKPLIISQLDEALRNGEVVLHEAETITELKGYVRDEKGRMSGSPFDDRVMALALAHHGRQFVHQRVPEELPVDDTGTGGWWAKFINGASDEPALIGKRNHRARVYSLYE
jgi:hypothetical protein